MRLKQQKKTNAFGVSLEEERSEDILYRLRRNSYSRHFEGYDKVTVLSSKGHMPKSEYMYVGALYHQELTKKDGVRLRILHAVLFFTAAVALLTAFALPAVSNHCWYVFVTVIVTGAFYVRQFFALLAYLPSGQDLKIREYKDGARILPAVSKWTAMSVFIPVIATIIMLILVPQSFSAMESLRFAVLMLSAACIYTSGYLERRVHYTEILPKPEAEQEEKL